MTEPSYVVTLYKLFLGDPDTITGHFRRGYTIHSITVLLYPEGGSFNFGFMGTFTSYKPIGFTKYAVEEGDVILDAFGKYYEIHVIKPWANGDQLQFYALNLEKLATFPFLAGFFGFEDEEHGTIGCMFEDGFERGYWAL